MIELLEEPLDQFRCNSLVLVCRQDLEKRNEGAQHAIAHRGDIADDVQFIDRDNYRVAAAQQLKMTLWRRRGGPTHKEADQLLGADSPGVFAYVGTRGEPTSGIRTWRGPVFGNDA